MNNLKINWDLWYHSINDNNWKKDSYKKISNIESLCDYQYIKQTFQQDHYQNGMFFCMKEDIFPNWEDPDNSEGCCISFKIPGKTIKEEFCKILLHCITEDIMNDPEQYEELNGFSIAPKKEFNIAKMWMRNKQSKYTDLMKEVSPCLLDKDCMIKDNIAEK